MNELLSTQIDLIVIGCSAGCIETLSEIFSHLPEHFAFPMAVVMHVPPKATDLFAKSLGRYSKIPLSEAISGEKIQDGHIYLAPPDYHLLVEKEQNFSLSLEGKVNFSRPSIDVLFSSAARAYKNRVLGIVLTGSNSDGAEGLHEIIEAGGLGIVEDPKTAKFSEMPKAAMQRTQPHWVISAKQIADLLAAMEDKRG